MALTGRTFLAAICGTFVIGLLFPHAIGFITVNAVLLLAILVDLALAAPVKTLHFTRSGDTSVRLGEQASVHLAVVNPSRHTLRSSLRDAWPPSSWPSVTLGATLSRHRLVIPPGERRRLTTSLRPVRRGRRVVDRVTIRSYGPLGLAARQGSHWVPWSVHVLPSFESRKYLVTKLARLRELDGRTNVLTRGEGTEFDSLREYVPGDDTRSIDWRASARSQAVAVRTYRPERDRHVLLVLDTGRTSAGRVGDVPRLDAALDAVLLLTALAARAGDRVDVIAYNRRLRASVQGRTSRDLLPAVVSALSVVEPELVETDVDGLVRTALRFAHHRSLIVLFTSLDPAPVEEGLLPALTQLTHRHTVVLASVEDPRLVKMAAGRGTVEKVYEAAAASRAQQERRRTREKLRQLGVTVVDAPPEDLPPALADAYLSLKASGSL